MIGHPIIRHPSLLATWDRKYYEFALYIATKWSKDPRRKVGAVLCSSDYRCTSAGVNGLPPGFDDSLLLDRDKKNLWVLHAERNAIDRAYFDLKGSKMFVTSPPCIQCASSMVSVGVEMIFCPAPDPKSSWYEQQVAAQDCGARFILVEDYQLPDSDFPSIGD